MGRLSIQRGDDAGRLLVALSGELDAGSAPQLERFLSDLEAESHAGVILDLSGLSFVDSAGITVLVKAKHEAEAKGRQLVLRGPTPRVQRVFAVIGLSNWLASED